MRHTSGLKLLLGLLAVLFVQTARTQGTDVVPFREQADEMQGAILMVENNMLFVERYAIPYRFNVNADTRITVGRHAANLEDLQARKGHAVTVKFLVTRTGNMAQEVAVGGMHFPGRGRGMMHGMLEMHEMHEMHEMKGMPETCPMWDGPS